MGRGLTILLMLSLAANVFLGGFVAGRWFGGPPHHRVVMHGPMDRGVGMFRDTDVLSEEGRKAFHDVFKEKRGDLRPSFQEMRRLREEFGAALAADPWDRARVEKAFADLRAVESSHQSAFSTTLIDAFEKLSAADRKALVEAAHSREANWRERRRKDRGDRRPGGHGEGAPPEFEAPLDRPPGEEPVEDAPPPDE